MNLSRVEGKSSHHVWRLETDDGVFAVKELRLDRDRTFFREDVFRLERAAFAAGIPMPEPVWADSKVLVHRWVDGSPVREGPVAPSFAFEIGEVLARLHALDFDWPHRWAEDPMPTDWPELAASAAASHQPWADELRAAVDVLLAIGEFVDGCDRRGPMVLSHGDIAPWNLLDCGGHPVVLDWEIAGEMHLSSELGSTALNLCTGNGFAVVDAGVFRAVLDGYVAAGGALPDPGPDWFVSMLGGWTRFTRWNTQRCLAGEDAATEELRNGLRGLPEMFARLDEFAALIPT